MYNALMRTMKEIIKKNWTIEQQEVDFITKKKHIFEGQKQKV